MKITVHNPSKLIVDLYLGSGSMLITCEQLNKTCIGSEIDSSYIDIILIRYIQYKTSKSEPFTIKKNGQVLSNSEIELYLKQIEPKG